MAEVLEAEATGEAGFVRRVAIKRMLGTALEDPSFARMFLDEARIASSLHHANVVSVLDYGVVDGAPFQVLELVDGVDARTLLRLSDGGRLPLDVALYIVAQIGHALTAAHEATDPLGQPLGIVHRDVSPGNILVSWSADVKLADFGIAFAKDKVEKTEAGTTKGTLVYMSPEQALTGRVDARADVFSLGCVLYTLLTGASPLAGDGFSGFLIGRTIPMPQELPPDVRSILEMATRYDREQRFQSAGALTEAVGRALAARIAREPRRRLGEYLAEIRKKTRPVERLGKLDAFMQVEIILAGGDATVREFRASILPETVVAPPPQVDPAVPGLQPARVPVQAELPARGALRTPAVLAIAAVLVIAAGVATWRLSTVGGATAAPGAGLIPLVPTATTGPSSVGAPGPSASSLPPSEAPSGASVIEPRPRASTEPKHAKPKPSSVASDQAPEAAPSCSGTLYLSCPVAPRASVTLDGAPTALHHGEFVDVRCAPHVVVFAAPDGRKVTRGAQPTSANTRTSPVEVRCGFE